jgi:hypothetical protein
MCENTNIRTWSIGEKPNPLALVSMPIKPSEYDKNALKRPNKYKSIIPKKSNKPRSSSFNNIGYGANDYLAPPYKPNIYDKNALKRPNQRKTPIGTPYTRERAMKQFKEQSGETARKETPAPQDKKEMLKEIIKTTTDPELRDELTQMLNYVQRMEIIQSKRPLTVEEQKRLDEINDDINNYLENFSAGDNPLLESQIREQRADVEEQKRQMIQDEIEEAYDKANKEMLEKYPIGEDVNIPVSTQSTREKVENAILSKYGYDVPEDVIDLDIEEEPARVWSSSSSSSSSSPPPDELFEYYRLGKPSLYTPLSSVPPPEELTMLQSPQMAYYPLSSPPQSVRIHQNPLFTYRPKKDMYGLEYKSEEPEEPEEPEELEEKHERKEQEQQRQQQQQISYQQQEKDRETARALLRKQIERAGKMRDTLTLELAEELSQPRKNRNKIKELEKQIKITESIQEEAMTATEATALPRGRRPKGEVKKVTDYTPMFATLARAVTAIDNLKEQYKQSKKVQMPAGRIAMRQRQRQRIR